MELEEFFPPGLVIPRRSSLVVMRMMIIGMSRLRGNPPIILIAHTLWIILQLSFFQEETANIATEVIFTKGSASKIKIPIFYQESKKKAKQ